MAELYEQEQQVSEKLRCATEGADKIPVPWRRAIPTRTTILFPIGLDD